MKTEECLALAEWEVTVRSLLLDRHYLWLNFFSCLIVVKNNQLPIIFLKSCKFHVLHLFVTSHLTQKALSEYIIKTNNVLLKQNSNKKPVTLLCHCWSIISPLQVSKSIHIIIYKLISKLSDSYHDKKKSFSWKHPMVSPRDHVDLLYVLENPVVNTVQQDWENKLSDRRLILKHAFGAKMTKYKGHDVCQNCIMAYWKVHFMKNKWC